MAYRLQITTRGKALLEYEERLGTEHNEPRTVSMLAGCLERPFDDWPDFIRQAADEINQLHPNPSEPVA